MKNEQGFIGVVVVIVLVLGLLFGPVLIFRHAKLASVHSETFTVQRKGNREMKKNADGSANQYANLIYTNKGVFDNTDSWFPWKTRSSDVYNQLETGKTYTCEIAGWRNGFLSWYKNIVTCDGFTYQ